jgi:MurNAc alpha-1-phosphate uridylyltransferase
MINAAMIFAAGFGTRMGMMTKNQPKPMIEVAGRPLIDYAMDLTNQANLGHVVVNTHYLPQPLVSHLRKNPIVQTIFEPEILETGGGLKNALPTLGIDPVYTLNSDAVWTGENPLIALRDAWDPKIMDVLFMLIPRESAQEHRGQGDFFLSETGAISRRGNANSAPYVYSGAQIVKTKALENITETAFSLNLLWDRYLAGGRAYGIVHSGGWVDVGTPHGISVAETELNRTQNV